MGTVNALIAATGFILAACAVDRMDRDTAHAIRVAVVLVGIALLGQAMSVWFESWAPPFDTLLYGSIAAYLLACRRLDVGAPFDIPVPWTQRLSLAVSGLTFAAFFWGVF